MDALSKKSENVQKSDGFRCSGGNAAKIGSSFLDLTEEAKESTPPPLGWPIRKGTISKCDLSEEKENQHNSHLDDSKFTRISSKMSDIDMMKERFCKLLLGEDMSGSGKGVCTALAVSNAITNLWATVFGLYAATVFGQLWRLEPLPYAKKAMWRREMEWILHVSDHIVELIPSWQTFPDGSKVEVMTCRPRSDLFINLPALRKLDNMLLEILDSFTNKEFWYVDQGTVASDEDGSASFRQAIKRQDEKWWLPVPRVPPSGLCENSRKQLNHTRECANQILKAAMAINNIALAEIEVPESYLESLPKNGRSCLGDFIYRYITSTQFSPDCLLDCLDLSCEHVAVGIANRVEASIHVWRSRAHSNRPMTKSSWETVKDFMADVDKRELLAERAENILLCLKQRFPALTQTTLDTSKIQFNKDVGKSILESYSRVLESTAFNIIARIDDLLYVDDLTVDSDRFPLVQTVSVSGTPRKTAVSTRRFSSARRERTPIQNNNNSIKPHRRGFGVRRALSNYLRIETKPKICNNNSTEVNCSNSNPCFDRTDQKNKER